MIKTPAMVYTPAVMQARNALAVVSPYDRQRYYLPGWGPTGRRAGERSTPPPKPPRKATPRGGGGGGGW